VSREDFRPKSNDPVGFDLEEPVPAKFVRLDAGLVAPNTTNLDRVAMAEFSVFTADGVNHALADLGAKVTCGTQAGGGKVTVDDNFWEEPSQTGIKWVFVEDGTRWEQVERTRGQYALPGHVRRAFGMGRPRGVHYVLPVTTHNPIYTGVTATARREAFAEYVSFLAGELRGTEAGMYLRYDGPHPTLEAERADQSRLVRAAKAAAPDLKLVFVAGPVAVQDDGTCRLPDMPAEELMRQVSGLVIGAITDARDGTSPEEAWSEASRFIRQQNLPCAVWMAYPPFPVDVDGTEAPAAAIEPTDLQQAALLGRCAVTSLAASARLYYTGSASGTGILNTTATPEPPLYVMKALATVLNGASPMERDRFGSFDAHGAEVTIECFDSPTGPVAALWQKAPVTEQVESALCDIVLAQNAGDAFAVDGLSCVIQPLEVSEEAGKKVIRGLRVNTWPVFIKIPR